MSKLILSFFLLSFISCGNSHHKNKTAAAGTTAPAVTPSQAEVSFAEGSYKITFENLNPSYYSVKGSGTLSLTASEMIVSINMTKAPLLRTVYQNLYKGDCPTIQDDKNGDGIIDIKEALNQLTHVIIPLDSDINSSSTSKNNFPQSSILGKYKYSSKGSVAKITEDLKKNGEMKKIYPEDTVVLLQGLPVFYRFPNSVESHAGLPVTETLPIACGRLEKSIP